jgi:hypothetical protein
MMSSRRFHLHALAGIGLALAAGVALPSRSPAQAVQGPQEAPLVPERDMRGLGPQLRRFQPAITPPEQVDPAPVPAPVESDAAPAQREQSDAAPQPLDQPKAARASNRPRQESDRTTPRDAETDDARRTSDAAPAPAPSAVEAETAPAARPLDQPLAPPVVEAAPEQAEGLSILSSWPYLAALLVGLGLGAVLMRRRRNEEPAERTEFQIVAEPAPSPVPAAPMPAANPVETADAPSFLYRPTRAAPQADPVPEPVISTPQDGVVGIQIRPWLRLEFKPARAAATDVDATVQYELIVTNGGNEVARNVRIEARMFNAGAEQEQEIKRFFETPIPASNKNRILAIPARNSAQMRGVVGLPKEDVREIEVNGRKLFIPTVAINVCYEWGNGRTGQTSMSYIIGREPETPSSKMGPFRLDLGPRIYRQVGHRPSQPELVV